MYELKQPVLLDGQPGRVWGKSISERVTYDVLPDEAGKSLKGLVVGVTAVRLGAV